MKEIVLFENKISYIEPSKFKPNKSSIVFCHGFDSNYIGFIPLINLLNDKYNCFGLDYPAHGRSKGSFVDMNLPFFAKTIKEFIKAKDLKKVTLVGHSLGGGVVSYLEKEDFIEKMILVAPINPSIVGDEVELAKMLLPLVGNEYKESMNLLIGDWNNVDKKKILGETRVNKQVKGVAKRHAYMMAVTKDVLKRKRQWEILWNYLNFKNKTLVIFGDKDNVIPTKESLLWLNKIIKNVEVSVIENCGHCPHTEKLEETYKSICSFMES